MHTPRCELLSISYEKISKLEVSSDDFKQIADQVVAEFRDVGFIRVVEIEDFDDQELLKRLKWFHEQTFVEKMKLALNRFNSENSNKYRGYMPLVGNCAVYKEQTDYGNDSISSNCEDPLRNFMEEKSIYPNEDYAREIQKNYQIYTRVADLILQLCAVGLGLPVNHFQNMHSKEHISTLRTLHYPPRNKETPRTLDDENQIVSTPEHQDSSILTLLCTFENYGLQVRDKQNSWSWVIPKRNTLIVNLGLVMESMTNGELCATKHRVIDLGEDRYSVPMFVEPHFDDISYATNIRTKQVWTGSEPPLKYGIYNVVHGGRHSEYSEITRDPRIDLVKENVNINDDDLRLFRLQGTEKQLVFLQSESDN